MGCRSTVPADPLVNMPSASSCSAAGHPTSRKCPLHSKGTLAVRVINCGVVMAFSALAAQAQIDERALMPTRLEQLITSALTSHPSAQIQRELEEAAQSGVDSARWQYFPTPTVAIESADTRSSDLSYPGSSTVATLRLQQPLWTGGRLTAGLEKAEAGVTASQAAREEVRVQLAVRVIQSYGDWLSAHLKIQANEKSLATHTRLREQVSRRIQQGMSSESDLTLAVGRRESVIADISATQTQRRTALARLGQLLGRRVDSATMSTVVVAPRSWNRSLQTVLDQALATNPTIQKMQAQARIQEATITERRANLSPEVYVRAERQYGNYSYPSQRPENRIFVGINTRFGAGLSNASDIESAKSQHRAALAAVDAQRNTIDEQIQTDHALAESAEAHIAALTASLDAARQVSDSFDRQFLAGRKTWLDVMNAARELTQIEVQLAETRAAQIVVTWRLALYTQGIEDVLTPDWKQTGNAMQRHPALALSQSDLSVATGRFAVTRESALPEVPR